MAIEGNVLQSHPWEAGVPHGSAILPILFAIYNAGVMNWEKHAIQGVEGLSIGDDLWWVATWNEVNQVVKKLEACTPESTECASRQDDQFQSTMKEVAI